MLKTHFKSLNIYSSVTVDVGRVFADAVIIGLDREMRLLLKTKLLGSDRPESLEFSRWEYVLTGHGKIPTKYIHIKATKRREHMDFSVNVEC